MNCLVNCAAFRALAILCVLPISGCVTTGYEGQVGTLISGDQVAERREANRTIAVFDAVPGGYRPAGQVSVRRCHRSFVEADPSLEALTDDLKLSAYAKGADAISNIRTRQMNGLLANCWYVVEATADVWRR